MANEHPLVSVGMVVYNGEAFIRESLDSLVAQEYANVEIVISDNASSDQTGVICREYAEKYDHISYSRNLTNLGAVANSNKVLELSRGTYFMWASDHDVWHPSFIARCVAEFEHRAEVVLVYPQTALIDTVGRRIKIMDDGLDMTGLSSLQRYKYVIWKLRKCNMIYGLISIHALDNVGRVKNVWGPDQLLLAELALQGTLKQIPHVLFFRRKNRPEEKPGRGRIKQALLTLDPATALHRNQKPDVALWAELRNAHLKMLISSSLSFAEKVEAMKETIICFQRRFHVPTIFSYLPKSIKHYFTTKSFNS